MPLVLVRHAQRLDYILKAKWMSEAERPFDTPITEHGHVQSRAAGETLRRHLTRLGLPIPTKIFSSPLLRCVETSFGIREGLRKEEENLPVEIFVENYLVESMCENWYRSWGIKGISDSTWGGPRTESHEYETGAGFDEVELLEQTKVPAGQLLKKAADFLEHFNLNTSHVSSFSPTFTVENPESHAAMTERLGKFAHSCEMKFPGETIVLCSHGGPLYALFHHLTGSHSRTVGFTAISILERSDATSYSADGKGAYKVHLAMNVDHLPKEEDLGLKTAFKEEEGETNLAVN